MKILTIIPKRESTQLALFEDATCVWTEEQEYERYELDAFPDVASQEEFRLERLSELLARREENVESIEAFVAVGGCVRPVEGGAYQVSAEMLEDVRLAVYGEDPANLGAPLAARMALAGGTNCAFVAHPPFVDEMDEPAHITGFPGIRRRSSFHALNQKTVVAREAESLGKSPEACNFVVCHMDDDTVSVGAHRANRAIDVTDVYGGAGPMSLCKSGPIAPIMLIDICFSGEYTQDELKEIVRRAGGMRSLLGTATFEEIAEKVRRGDAFAQTVHDAFVRQLVREIAAAAAVLDGCVDSVILTGELAVDADFLTELAEKLGWIAPVVAYPGKDDALALAEVVLRLFDGTEELKRYA